MTAKIDRFVDATTALIMCLLVILSVGATIGFCINYKAESKDKPPTETTTSPPETIPTRTYYDCPLSERLQDYISEQCEDRNLPMPLVLAVIEKESSFRADAVSRTNDYGLMQVNEVNHERFTNEYGITDFLDPYQNVFCGITILAEHYTRYGDVNMALMAYNLGASGARELWGIGIYSTDYTEQIRANMTKYKGGL